MVWTFGGFYWLVGRVRRWVDCIGVFFEKVYEMKVVKCDHIGNLKVFPDSQDHPDSHGSIQELPGGPESGHTQRLSF